MINLPLYFSWPFLLLPFSWRKDCKSLGRRLEPRRLYTISHRYLIYTRCCILHSGQAKIEANSQALVVPTKLTRSMIICILCIAEMDKNDNKSSFMQLKSI